MDAKTIVLRWFDAMEARDAKALLEALADDVEVRTEGMARPIVGKETVRELLTGFLEQCEFIRIEREKVIAANGDVAALLRARTRLRSDLNVLDETLPTAHKDLDVTAAVFLTVNAGGKITHMARVRDNFEFVRQLHIEPARLQSLIRKIEERLAA